MEKNNTNSWSFAVMRSRFMSDRRFEIFITKSFGGSLAPAEFFSLVKDLIL